MRRVGATELARRAVLGLYHRRPDLSAGARGTYGPRVLAAVAAVELLVVGALFLAETLLAVELILGAWFLAWTGFRLRACCLRPPRIPPLALLERDFPLYTIMVPLLHEAHMVPRLVAALRRLDYSPEKLDVKLVVEADDPATRLAVAQLKLGAPFEEIVAPLAGPRTKPKALAAALPFARGSFLVIYDAEDQPDSDQLRRALAAFHGAPPELACVQARLAIDNAEDNWLTRQYAAEYAGLFDVFLPSLAALRLPIPLGGTPTTSAPRPRAEWAAGTRSMSPRIPTSACALPASATVSASSPRPPTRRRRPHSGPGCTSARAGLRAGSRRSSCTCARRDGCLPSLASRDFWHCPHVAAPG